MTAKRGPWIAAAALALVFGAQAWIASLDESVTWDEPGYVAAGYVNWVEGDYRLNRDHPPLMQKLEALPLLFMDVEAPPLDGEGGIDGAPGIDWDRDVNPRASYGRAFFFRSGNDPVALARASRAPVVLLGMALVLAIFAFTRALVGSEAALVASALAAFDPNLLTHGRLATEDLGCALFLFVAAWTLWRWLAAPTLGRALVCGVATAAALLSKYTGLLVLPIDAVLLAIAWWRQPPARPWRRTLGEGLAMAGCTLGVVNFAYGFGFFLDRYATGVLHLYPELAPQHLHYFFGQVSQTRFWYHAIASLAIKTPLSVWALGILAALAVARAPAARRHLPVILVPPLVVLLASCFDVSSPGVRRVLPALPFLLVFASLAVVAAPRAERADAPRLSRVAVWGLVALSALEAARTFPHHLPYLNPAFGGAERGPYVLDESNVDWGQALPALARWQREHREQLDGERLTLLYFGVADPAAYGVDAVPLDLQELADPPPGVVAVSSHYLAFFRKIAVASGQPTDWLSRYEPTAKVAHAIWIYRFPADTGTRPPNDGPR